MDVQTLFGNVPLTQFVGEYLHRQPFALAGSARSACELGTWESVGAMLADAGDDAFAVRGGEWHEGDNPRDQAAARALSDEGYTIFIRHAERHAAGLAELARAFERAFLGAVNIHVFVTPAGTPGFSWHYDAEDVFIIQTTGEKEYSLRKNTVNPWPLEETLPADMRYEREQMPLMRTLLRAGDLLYIPCGWWHKAEAKGMGEASISLAVGVMSPTAMSVYDFLRKRLVESLVWRQRLPLVGPASSMSCEEMEATYGHLFKQLADDLAKIFADPRMLSDFLAQLTPPAAHEEPRAGEEH